MGINKIAARQLDLALADHFKPTAKSPANNQIAVGNGYIKDGMLFTAKDAQNTVGFNPVSSASNSRWDLVSIDPTGAAVITQGIEKPNPVTQFDGLPFLTPYSLPVAAVKITENGTVVVEDSDVVDIRPLLNILEQRVYGHNYAITDATTYQIALAALDTEAQRNAEFSGKDSLVQTSPVYSTKGAPQYAITDAQTLALAIAKVDTELNRLKSFLGKTNLAESAPDYSGYTTHHSILANDPIRNGVGKLDDALYNKTHNSLQSLGGASPYNHVSTDVYNALAQTGANPPSLTNKFVTQDYIASTSVPRQSHVFADDATRIVGNSITVVDPSTNQRYNFYAYQNTAADGDTLQWHILLDSGTYNVYVLGISDSNCGKVDWYLDGVLMETGQDWYSGGIVYNAVKTFSYTVPATGYHILKSVINGKTGSGYRFLHTKTSFVKTIFV